MFKFGATSLPVIEVESITEEATVASTQGTDNTLLWIIIAIVVAVIAIAAIVILICVLVKNKNANKKQNNVSYIPEQRVVKPQPVRYERKSQTMKISGQSGHTQHLWGTKESEEETNIFLYLVDDYDNSRSFRAPIHTQVIVGRREGDIIIAEDSSLSKRHCRFIRRGNIYYIEDLNSSNGTRYNGQLIQGETPIMPGGVIEIGRQRLRMEVKEVTR